MKNSFCFFTMVLFPLTFLLLSCSSNSSDPAPASETSMEELVRTCSFMQFEGDNSNYGIEREDVVFLRSFRGRVTSMSGYRWPKGIVLMQARPVDGHRTYKARAKANGDFLIPNLPMGRYCYLVTVDGWQSEKGQVVIRRNAQKNTAIEILLLLDM